MQSTKKRVTFGSDEIFYVENISMYLNPDPMGFLNVLKYHFSSLENVKIMPCDEERRMEEMARICYLISHNKSIQKVSFTLSEKCSNSYFQNVVTMLQCGLNSNEITCEYSLGDNNGICLYDEFINVSVDDNFTLI